MNLFRFLRQKYGFKSKRIRSAITLIARSLITFEAKLSDSQACELLTEHATNHGRGRLLIHIHSLTTCWRLGKSHSIDERASI